MAEAEGIPPTASVASVGPGIRYVGNWIYSYSGVIGVTDSETTLADFTSGAGIIRGKIQFNMISVTSDDYLYYTYFNNTIIQAYYVLEAYRRGKADTPLEIIIPPFTQVKLTAQNTSSSTSNDNIVSLIGRVYDA